MRSTERLQMLKKLGYPIPELEPEPKKTLSKMKVRKLLERGMVDCLNKKISAYELRVIVKAVEVHFAAFLKTGGKK